MVTGIQKGRVGIGILAFFLAPIGFLFALAAENRKAQAEERPDCLEGIVSEDNLMPVEEFARQKGLSPDQVVQQIKDGTLAGQISGEQWYVNIELTSRMSR